MRGDEVVSLPSELAGLASDRELPLEIDADAIASYLQRGFIARLDSVQNVSRVARRGGHGSRPGRFAHGDSGLEVRDRRFGRAVGRRVRPRLRAAVARQSDVAVPCGVFLSGGSTRRS